MKLMLDANVVLDFIQHREPHYAYSALVIQEVIKKRVAGMLPIYVLTTMYYILAKQFGRTRANQEIDWLLAHFEIAAGDKAVLLRARKLPCNDFEDAVVACLAEVSGCQWIITRNIADFEDSPIAAMTPEAFMAKYGVATQEGLPQNN